MEINCLPFFMTTQSLFPIRKLLSWFNKNQRTMPWRSDRHPYTVWVSEIMLQQTRVDQVEPYYRRFMDWFPDIRSLARAPLEKVLKAWEGLGYYSRARHLHQSAQRIVNEYGGTFPDRYDELFTLPGIGRSTAGAILSLAFDRPYPVLDGNIKRVLIRFYRIRRPVGEAATVNDLWRKAEGLIPSRKPGRFNEALMELGALVCLPRNPACGHCPLREACLALLHGNPEKLPAKTPRRKIPHYQVTAAVIRKGKKILITRRPEKGLLGGLWEFPGGKQKPGESLAECLKREIEEELGIAISVGEPFMQVNHAYSHFKITLHPFFCRHLKGRIQKIGVMDYRWVTSSELSEYAFPRADRRVIAYLNGSQGPHRQGLIGPYSVQFPGRIIFISRRAGSKAGRSSSAPGAPTTHSHVPRRRR